MRFAIVFLLFFSSCGVQVMTLQRNESLPFKGSCIKIVKQEPVEGNPSFKRIYYKDKCH